MQGPEAGGQAERGKDTETRGNWENMNIYKRTLQQKQQSNQFCEVSSLLHD